MVWICKISLPQAGRKLMFYLLLIKTDLVWAQSLELNFQKSFNSCKDEIIWWALPSQRQVRSHPLNTENLLYTTHHVVRSVRLYEKTFYKVPGFSVQSFDEFPRLVRCWEWPKLLVASFNNLKNIPRSFSLTKWITDLSGWHSIVGSIMAFCFCDSEMAWEFLFPKDPGVLLQNPTVVPEKACSKERTITVWQGPRNHPLGSFHQTRVLLHCAGSLTAGSHMALVGALAEGVSRNHVAIWCCIKVN